MWPILFAHPEFLDHRLHDIRRLGKVVMGTRRDLPEGQLFSDPAAKKNGKAVKELLLRHQVAVLGGPLHGIAEGRDPPRYDGDLVHRVRRLQKRRHQRVARLMIRHDLLFLSVHNLFLLLQAGEHPVYGFVELRGRHRTTCPSSP